MSLCCHISHGDSKCPEAGSSWPRTCRFGSPLMSSFATYVLGFIILVVGLAMAAYLLDVPSKWIAVGVIVALGIGVITATARTKMKDPPGTS
jgi:hypothetical protein